MPAARAQTARHREQVKTARSAAALPWMLMKKVLNMIIE
jgi:hypothetical protein